MKFSKFVFAAIAAALLLSISVQAKDEIKRVYIFGFASSFNDSTVCITDIQAVDSAWLNTKNHFLVSRENYSYQLRDYLEAQGHQHPTCMVSYGTSLKTVKKKWDNLLARYTAKPKVKKQKSNKKVGATPNYQVKKIGMDQFVFQAIQPDNVTEEETTEVKSSPKTKAKKAFKEQKKKHGRK